MQIVKESLTAILGDKRRILACWMSGEFSSKLISCLPSVLKMNFGVCRLHSVENILNLAPAKRTFSYMTAAFSFRSVLG